MDRHRTSFPDGARQGHGLHNGDVEGILSSIRQMATMSGSSQRKLHSPPKNFTRENLQRLREIQRLSQQRESAKANPVKALWQSKEYRNVQSTVSGFLKSGTGRNVATAGPRTNSRSRSFERGTTASPPSKIIHSTNQHELEDKISNQCTSMHIPKLQLKNKEEEKSDQKCVHDDGDGDHVKNPVDCKQEVQLRRVSSTPNLNAVSLKTTSPNTKHRIGVVPKYLLVRKKQWQEEEARRQKEAERPMVPIGHELLSEEQRVQTLKLLEERYRSVLSQMSSLPVCSDTLRVRRLKEDFEAQILQTEEAIKIFSHAKVYIKNDT